MEYHQALRFYSAVIRQNNPSAIRKLCLTDRFFLLAYILGVKVARHPWIYARCKEVEAEPDGRLDLWSRGHFKSTLITYAGVIQEILRNPEITVAIFSHNNKTAKAFLNQIKVSLEKNKRLHALFPDILYIFEGKDKPERWNLDDGIWVKRHGTPKEATVSAFGLVDGMPTGGHWALLVYDDVVTPDSVTTPDMIAKTTAAWSMSLNLVTLNSRMWYIGTRYHIFDTWSEVLKRKAAIERRHISEDEDGRPVLLTPEEYAKRKAEMSPKDWASQMLQQPVADGEAYFREEWLCFYAENNPPPRNRMNIYLIMDGAAKKKRTSDYTAIWVIGLCDDGNYYLLDGCRDRLDVGQRIEKLFELQGKWRPLCVYIEEAGQAADGEILNLEQERLHRRFPYRTFRQTVKKEDRIGWLVPLFRNRKIWLPQSLKVLNAEGDLRDLVLDLKEQEYAFYPAVAHDDMLDCLANILHPECRLEWPIVDGVGELQAFADGIGTWE